MGVVNLRFGRVSGERGEQQLDSRHVIAPRRYGLLATVLRHCAIRNLADDDGVIMYIYKCEPFLFLSQFKACL